MNKQKGCPVCIHDQSEHNANGSCKDHGPQPQHTPTPWQIAATWAKTSIVDSARKGAWMEVAKAGVPEDAAYIVKCVNSHEALVTSGKRLIERVKDTYLCSSPELEAFRNALAQAEEK